jgi:hypothetical protein
MERSMFSTILVGVTVFVLGQFILKLALDPIVLFRETLGELSAIFLQNQAEITSATAPMSTQNEIRKLTSTILAHKQAIPFYRVFSFILRLPTEEAVSDSCLSLNWLSYNVIAERPNTKSNIDVYQEIDKHMRIINKKLNIQVFYI